MQVCQHNCSPVVDVVEQAVQILPGVESLRFGNEAVVGAVELGGEAAKHSRNGQVKFVMAVERGRIECH